MGRNKNLDLDSLLDDSSINIPKGHDIRSLGPSDSSDTGADMAGVAGTDSTGDRYGTGDRASAEDDLDLDMAADISPDNIVSAEEAGLGGGLDQAEEAQLGITDEEIEAALLDQGDLLRD